MNQKEFSKLVKNRRNQLGLSQFDFGSEIGTSWITIWRWENEINMPKPDAIGFWIKRIENGIQD